MNYEMHYTMSKQPQLSGNIGHRRLTVATYIEIYENIQLAVPCLFHYWNE
jgi:hypothetical protein